MINGMTEDEFIAKAHYNFAVAILELMAQQLKDILNAINKNDRGTMSPEP